MEQPGQFDVRHNEAEHPLDPYEMAAKRLMHKLSDADIAQLIALPDCENLTAFEQVALQFDAENDPELWRMNITLLVGIAAHKLLYGYPQDEDNYRHQILGCVPEDIVKDYASLGADNPEVFDYFQLPLPKSFRILGKQSWFQPEKSADSLQFLRRTAERVIKLNIADAHESADIVNPKVAFLWGSNKYWGVYAYNDKFRNWLESFRGQAKELMLLEAIEQVRQGNVETHQLLSKILR